MQILHDTHLLDTAEAVPSLDRLTRLVARLTGAPVALVSLVDKDRQFFASAVGLDPPLAAERQTPLSQSWCKHLVTRDGPLIIEDAAADPLVCDSLTDGTIALRSYAGFPLLAPGGQVLGSFCVADVCPRDWTDAEVSVIRDLAGAASTEIALRLAHADRSNTAERLQAVLDGMQDAFVTIDMDGAVTAWNAAAERLFGRPADAVIGRPVTELIVSPRFRPAHERGFAAARINGTLTKAGQRLEVPAIDDTGREFPVEMLLQVGREHGKPVFHAFIHDISDRKAAQQQLEYERTFLQSLLDSLDTGVVACDRGGNLVLFNRALRGAGHAVEHLEKAGKWPDPYQQFAADGRRQLLPEEEPLNKAFAGIDVQGEELIIRIPGESPRRFLANGRRIDAADGQPLGAVVAMHDITEQHRLETFRAAQHAVARALADAENAEDAAATTVAAVAEAFGWACGEYWHVHDGVDGGSGRIVRFCSWVAPGAGLSAFTGDQSISLHHGEGLAGKVWATGHARWIRDVQADTDDFTRRREAQQAGLHAAIGLPVRSGRRVLGVLTFFAETIEDDGELLAVLEGICAYIGQHIERRRADDLTLALAAARRDFNRVIERVNDFVWTVGIADGTVYLVYASPNSAGVFGDALPTDGDVAASVADRVHPDDLPMFHRFRRSLADTQEAQVEFRIRAADGRTRWIWTRATTRRDGASLFVDGISTDITERRQLAEQREQLVAQQKQQLDRLRELDRMKDELVAVVSHELCNPIATIRSYAEMLFDDVGLDADARNSIEVIDRHSARLQEIVNDLLDLARLDAGHVTIMPALTSLTSLIAQAVDDHRGRADAKRIGFVVDLPQNLPVRADPARLRQVFDNLIANAIKYTLDDGTIKIVAGVADGRILVDITDNGIGIPADQYHRLFSRFFRATTATQHGIKGTGLGLAIVKAIVTAHDGTITAHPAAGGGTTFTMELPVATVTPAGETRT
ncbi:hypothetical protein GCM10010172_65470 [Paractinoplanes ferrugineus]|uniref:Sensor-like histidine kinase SenX3 n=1 Tax=Paractinoplanes ferrugineus TaxID=113564 RepID=A0A919MMI3_9ACTN|nr:PAS domain S-box protein [Actinoplanes ferrugineus]GIE13292.1 hypothetical protein Afe05nite_51320 [Actinoplanes ferrugineus]